MRVAGLIALALVTLAGCRDAPRDAPTKVEASKPLVVASFYPLYDFARQIAGDKAEVVSLVPAGVEPHDWEPAPRDVARVEKATLFIYHGADFDPGAARLAKTAAAAGRVVAEATAGLSLLPTDHPAHEKVKNRPPDPHVWLDPTLAQGQVTIIRDALAKADPSNAQHYTARAATYTTRLGGLHDAYSRGLAECKRREIVVSHAAFTYLAHRYKLLQVPVMGLAPQSEPSPAEIARVVRTVRRIKAKVIFFETLVSGRLADTLASEVGATTMVLNPIEGLTPEEEKAGKDYVSLMEQNLENLRTALECR